MLMFDTAMINSCFILEKPSDFANKVNRLVEVGFCEDYDEVNVEEELVIDENDVVDTEMENVD